MTHLFKEAGIRGTVGQTLSAKAPKKTPFKLDALAENSKL
jgi:hypothetical protein